MSQAMISGVSPGMNGGHMAAVNTREMTDPLSQSFCVVFLCDFWIFYFPPQFLKDSFLTYH